MKLYDTKSLYSKILHAPNHGLLKQVAYSGDGRGQWYVTEGHPQVHKVVLDLLKFDIVWRVICDTDYFMITVSEPRRWPEIEGEMQHVVARFLDDS